MQPRIFHGEISPSEVARALIGRFNRGNLRVQQMGAGQQIVVQIATRDFAQSGGQTALTVNLQQVTDGVSVQISRQSWLGVAASLGSTAFAALVNPLNLLGRLDDIAQDIENLQLTEQVWQTIEALACAKGVSFELSERLRRLVCSYCHSANPIGAPSCVACGAPLGDAQPKTCSACGFVVKSGENFCPNCGQVLR